MYLSITGEGRGEIGDIRPKEIINRHDNTEINTL